jgi:hypothetical protein
MNEIKEGSEGYARFIIGNSKIQRGVTAWVRIIHIDSDYILLKDNDDFQYHIKRGEFTFKRKDSK